MNHGPELDINAPNRGPLDPPKISCLDCKLILQTLKTANAISPAAARAVARTICPRYGIEKDVCEGTIDLYGPHIAEILPQIEPFGYSGTLGCATIVHACPYPESKSTEEITLPPLPEKSPSPKERNSTLEPLTIVHLSDWHVDPKYIPGSEVHCTKPLCCRGWNETSNGERIEASVPAPSWGAYTCDAPQKLLVHMLEQVERLLGKKPDFAIFTGDVPPHDVWETTQYNTTVTETVAFNTMRQILGVPIFPTIGNHETSPSDLFQPASIVDPPDNQWLFDNLTAKSWFGWLGNEELEYARTHRGRYTTRPMEGLKIISVNTNDCYAQNYWLFADTSKLDPNGQLAWLAEELADSEEQGERVWIITHIPPGVPDCFRSWSEVHHQIVQRYWRTIVGVFSGHTHRDEIKLFYANDTKTISSAIGVNWIGPSVTPFTQLNPGWRAYTVDPQTFEILDSRTFVTDLSLASELDEKGTEPVWEEAYGAREYFPDWPGDSPLNATFWAEVVARMEREEAVFRKYFSRRGKGGPSGQVECDEQCKQQIIAGIRAGKSGDVSVKLGREEVWARDLCGVHSHH
ncbi:sphingomyelin phosphodiesterase [Dacryopinax primogenitus]|uniref:Sphingomyelin phosphodiesterase n=1 Tax=Dacryopinax primogenitus (strain DJM 731) TaxID=1858805 RepID=M5GED5_DACPD|nr:sphingomyelin phosphodiesterase [Dacryopinax primogenitus]EJU03163.1 sphingomyelin phosphodiesterase [Dacryopinax primogenitus]